MRGAERRPPLLQSCMQSSVIVPALPSWRGARLLLHTGHLCGDICKCIIGLVLLSDLVEMPATVPASSMPTASTPASSPATSVGVQRAAAHAVAPVTAATSHSGVLIAKVANTMRGAERRPPLLQSCMQSSVIVPALPSWRGARLLLHTGHLQEG